MSPTEDTMANGVEQQLVDAADGTDKRLLNGNGRADPHQPQQQLQFAEPQQRHGPVKMRTLLRQHWPLILVFWLSHICIGMGSALPGTSLLQLAQQVGASLGVMGFWFTVKSITCCLLALLTSFLLFRLPGGSPGKAVYLAGGNLASAAAMLGAGLARSCALALCLAGLLGAGHGALETANSLLAIRAFGSQHSRPILHSLHFSTAVGGLAAPLLLRAFTDAPQANATAAASASGASGNLTGQWEADRSTCGADSRRDNETVLNISSAATTPANATASVTEAAAEPLRLVGPYTVLFAMQTAVSVGLVILAVRRYHVVPQAPQGLSVPVELDETTPMETTLSPHARTLPTWRQRLLIALTVVFYFAAVGGENIFWSLVTAYGTCSPALRLDARGASALHAAFFGGFLAGRGLGVAVSHWARPTVIMLAHLTGCLLALVTLCLAAAPWLTYAGTAAFGFCVSVLYATGVTWLEQRLDVVGPVACSWSIGGQLGISVLPALAGHLLVSPGAGPAAVMHLALGAMTTAAVTFLLMLLTAMRLRCSKA